MSPTRGIIQLAKAGNLIGGDGATGAGIRQLACVTTPTVTAVFDDKGEVAAAIADVDTLVRGSPATSLIQYSSVFAQHPCRT